MRSLSIALLSCLWAQGFETSFYIGPQVTALLTKSGQAYDLRWRGIGFLGGVSETFWFADRWGASLEAQYSWSQFDRGSGNSGEVKRFVTSLKLPVLVRYRVPLSEKIWLSMGAGAHASLILSAEEDIRMQSSTGQDTTYTIDLFDKVQAGAEAHRRGVVGLAFSAGLQTRRFGISIWHDTILGSVNDPRRGSRRWYNSTALRVSYTVLTSEN